MSPTLSVIMPVFNGELYLKDAIESILCQSFNDFEFIIIDDGSTDGSHAVLLRYALADQRLHIYTQSNQGITPSLNRGLELATGTYIARMDADDISLPDRFQRQIDFMDKHPEIDVCGTWVRTIGDSPGLIMGYPPAHDAIRSYLIFGSPLAHPTVMIRRASFESAHLQYDVTYQRAQDYELWVRGSKLLRFCNLPEPLVQYRTHAQQAGQHDSIIQRQIMDRIQRALLAELQLTPTISELALHHAISVAQFQATKAFILQTQEWLLKLRFANKTQKLYDEGSFAEMLMDYWYASCKSGVKLGLWTFVTFYRSPIHDAVHLDPRRVAGLLLRCLKLKAPDTILGKH